MKFVQLLYFYHKKLGKQNILFPHCPKVGGPPFNSVPGISQKINPAT